MRILLWTQHFWPEHFHINEVALSLKAMGQEVTVLTGKPNYPGGRVFEGHRVWGIQAQVHEGVDVLRLPLRPRGVARALDLALNYLSFVASGYLLGARALRRKPFDVVFVYGTSPILQALPALFFARLRGLPLVLWVQDLWPSSLQASGFVRNKLVLAAVSVIVKYIYRNADLLLVQSEAFREPVELLGGDPDRIEFHPNSSRPVAPSGPVREDVQSLIRDIQRQFSIVYAGNIGTVQSMDTVLAAAALLRQRQDIRVFLIGQGSRAVAVAQDIERLGLANVSLHAWVAPDEIAAVYQATSVLLVPLKNDAQLARTIPNKLQVCLAAGKPIIVSSNGEPARILQRARGGLVCQAGDEHALAAAILQMKSMEPSELKALGANAKAYFMANFELERQTQQLVVLFENAVRRKRESCDTAPR